MKKGVFLSFMCSLTLLSSISAEVYYGPTKLNMSLSDTIEVKGPADLNFVKAQSVDIKGPLTFNHLIVFQKAEVKGPVRGNHGQFGILDVTGYVDAEYIIADELKAVGKVKVAHLEVKKHAEVIGELDLKGATLSDLTLTSRDSILEDVTVGKIVVKKDEDNRDQILTLIGKTTVNGDILFESGKGKVIIEGQDVSIKGSIKGAQVETKN